MRSLPLYSLLLFIALHSAAKGPTLNWPASTDPLRPGAPSYGTNGKGLHYFTCLEGGYSTGSSRSKADTSDGGGFMYGIELGMRIELNNSETRYNLLSLSLSYTVAPMSRYDFDFVSLPVSFCSIGTGRRGGLGLYWQAGAALRYTTGVAMGSKDVKGGFNKFLADPFLSVGINGPFRLLNHRHGDEIGGGRYMLGPCFSYTAMNMLKVGDMHGYMLGLRLQMFFS